MLDDFKVIILVLNKDMLVFFLLEDKGNGFCGFGWRFGVSGDYKIFIFNEKFFGGEVFCSLVIWEVFFLFYFKMWVFLFNIFDFFVGV